MLSTMKSFWGNLQIMRLIQTVFDFFFPVSVIDFKNVVTDGVLLSACELT